VATWPAPPNAGVVLSDRAVLRLERGGSLDAEIAPAELYPALRTNYARIVAAAHTLAADAFRPVPDPEARALLRRSGELDALLVELALAPQMGQPDLCVVYLPGLDIAQHALLVGTESPLGSPSAIAARVVAIETYYEFLDQLVARLRPQDEESTASEVLALVTEPGRGASGRDAGLLP